MKNLKEKQHELFIEVTLKDDKNLIKLTKQLPQCKKGKGHNTEIIYYGDFVGAIALLQVFGLTQEHRQFKYVDQNLDILTLTPVSIMVDGVELMLGAKYYTNWDQTHLSYLSARVMETYQKATLHQTELLVSLGVAC